MKQNNEKSKIQATVPSVIKKQFWTRIWTLILPIILVLILPIVLMVTLVGCFLQIDKRAQKDRISMYTQADQNIKLYLRENYPDYEFDLIADYSVGRPIICYIATEKSGKYLAASVDYNMESKKIIYDAIPAALIANQFEDFIFGKLREAFPNSKVYMERGKRISFDTWRLWALYEFNLENYLEYLMAVDTWTSINGQSIMNREDRKFFVVVDSKDLPDRLKQIKTFFSYSEDYKYKYNYHYIIIELLYVPTEYFNQTEKYFVRSSFGDRFNADTDFHNSIISKELIYVNTHNAKLYSNRSFGKENTVIE